MLTFKDTLPTWWAACTYGLYYTLGDWWEYSEIDRWQGASDIKSPLTLAAISNSGPLCRKLVQRGEIYNTQDIGDYGRALAAAAAEGNLEIVKFLLDAGANMDLPLENGRYGLSDIAEYHNYLETVSGESDTDWHHGIMTHKPCPR